jgi:3-oxoacyl-[acyl-carrier-protein] synthase II
MKRVVITGMGCVTPVGNDVDSFWTSIINGKHGFGEITKFDASEMKVKIAAEVKDFQPENYIVKNEIKRTDLYSQYAIAAATQAMEESGIVGKIAPERLGVYVSSGIGGMNTFETEAEKNFTRGPSRISPLFIPMMIANIAAALVAIMYNAQGPCLPVVTACATGTHSIGEAFRAIKHGYADAIIAGGAEASITQLAIGGVTNMMALSTRIDPNNCSTPFDKRRDGFVMGEGAGVVVLEEYEHAMARGANILAEIVGYGNTCDAYHITAPHPEAQGSAKMIQLTLEEAGIVASEGLYINPHGTSTPMNDKIETKAIKVALGGMAYKIPISSTKSMTGHMLGAAGGVEAIVAIKALQNNMVPPTIGYQEPDEDCDLDYVPNKARAVSLDAAMSISLGFGGHNAGIVFKKV